MGQLERLLEESGRRRERLNGGGGGGGKFAKAAATLMGMLFPKQQAVAKDPSKRIGVRCPRRAGKTTVVRARLMRRCLLYPGSTCLYIALTRPKAEELMWLGKSGLKAICKALDLVEGVDVEFHNAKLLMTFSNGSSIQLAGASTSDEIDKFRGSEYDEVWIDEAKSYSAKIFRELLEEALEPALMTRDGVLGMIGTPGNILDGKFYGITRPGSEEAVAYDDEESARERERTISAGEDTGETLDLWSFHEWTLQDNVAEPEQWARALRIKRRNGWTDNNPIWRREFLGQWAADDTDHVYKFRKHLDDGAPWNIWTPGQTTKANPFGLPEGKAWNYVYGMDLGAADPFALQIIAYADDSTDLYQCHEFTVPRKTNFTSTQIGELLLGLIEKTGHPVAMVSDHSHLGGSILAEIQTRFGLHIEPAPRGANEKLDAIELTNGDLLDGRLRLFTGRKNYLMEEMVVLQWDETGLRELKTQSNHCCDALIYARRRALHLLATEPLEAPPPKGSPEALQRKVDEEELRAAHRHDDEGSDLAGFLAGEDWA